MEVDGTPPYHRGPLDAKRMRLTQNSADYHSLIGGTLVRVWDEITQKLTLMSEYEGSYFQEKFKMRFRKSDFEWSKKREETKGKFCELTRTLQAANDLLGGLVEEIIGTTKRLPLTRKVHSENLNKLVAPVQKSEAPADIKPTKPILVNPFKDDDNLFSKLDPKPGPVPLELSRTHDFANQDSYSADKGQSEFLRPENTNVSQNLTKSDIYGNSDLEPDPITKQLIVYANSEVEKIKMDEPIPERQELTESILVELRDKMEEPLPQPPIVELLSYQVRIGSESIKKKPHDIYVGSSASKTTISGINVLKDALYMDKVKPPGTGEKIEKYGFTMLVGIRKYNDSYLKTALPGNPNPMEQVRKYGGTPDLNRNNPTSEEIPDYPSDVLLFYMGKNEEAAFQQNPRNIIAEKSTTFNFMRHMRVITKAITDGMQANNNDSDRLHIIQNGSPPTISDDKDMTSIILIEAKNIRVYKNRSPYVLQKDSDRKLDMTKDILWEITTKVTLTQLSLSTKRFRTLINSSRDFDPHINFLNIEEGEHWFEFTFITSKNSYIYYWSPKISSWLNYFVDEGNDTRYMLPDDDQKLSICDIRFAIRKQRAHDRRRGPVEPAFFDTWGFVLALDTSQTSRWRVYLTKYFFTVPDYRRQQSELGYVDFNSEQFKLEQGQSYRALKILPFHDNQTVLVLGMMYNKDEPVGITAHRLDMQKTLQEVQQLDLTEHTSDERLAHYEYRGAVKTQAVFSVSFQDTAYPVKLLDPNTKNETIAPYPEREPVIKTDIVYDNENQCHQIAIIATNFREIFVLSVPDDPNYDLQLLRSFLPDKTASAPRFKDLGLTNITWQEPPGNVRALDLVVSSGCNLLTTLDFRELQKLKSPAK